MARWDLVIFDLDGTLINTIGDLGNAVNHALEQHGFPTHEIEEYRMMVGHGIRNLVIRALPDGVEPEEVLASFVDYYSAHIDVLSRPYDGIHSVLGQLAANGTALAVASNKFQAGTEKLVERFFGDIPFCTVLGNRPELPLKPSAEVIKICMEAAAGVKGTDVKKVVMVGDSATDIKTAKNAGIKSIGVSWGFREAADIISAEPDYLIDSVDELAGVLGVGANCF